jgi:hypothetical protein
MQGNSSTNYAAGGSTKDTATVLTSDTSSPTAGLRSKTVSFVSAGTDFALASDDTSALDAGTSLAADGSWSFSDDILGTTRSGTWDVGPYEYVSAGSGVTASPGAGSLTLTRLTPSANIPWSGSPGTRALTLSASASTLNFRFNVGVAALALSRFTPALVAPITESPGNGSLSFSAKTPTADITSGTVARPGTAALVLSALAATISGVTSLVVALIHRGKRARRLRHHRCKHLR